MDFALLQQRLVALIRARVRQGEVTERGLARLAGVSQPHIHNVLKGVRGLSPEMADALMHRLRVDVLDLLERDELSRHGGARLVPVLRGLLGPEHTGALEQSDRVYALPTSPLDDVEDPLAAQVGEDPGMPPPLRAGDWVLLDRGVWARRRPDGRLYCIDLEGGPVIRFANLLGETLLTSPGRSLSMEDRDILEVVKAKVVWFGRRLEHPIV
jgi:hypothetical protein